MRLRNLSGNRDKPISTLRRSTRLEQKIQPESECPIAPKCVSRQKRVPFSDLTLLSSLTDEDSVNKSQKLKGGQCSQNSKRIVAGSRSSKKLSTGFVKSTRLNGGTQGFPCVRKSARLSQKANVGKISRAGDVEMLAADVKRTGLVKSTRLNGGAQGFPCVRKSARLSQRANVGKISRAGDVEMLAADVKRKERGSTTVSNKMVSAADSRKISSSVTEKRVTRSTSRGNNNGGVTVNIKGCNTLRKFISIGDMSGECVASKGKAEGAVNLSEEYTHRTEKRVTRSASRGIQDAHNPKFDNVKGLFDDGEVKFGSNSSSNPIGKQEGLPTFIPSADVVNGEDRMVNFVVEQKRADAKRKKIQAQEEHIIFDGWTTEQKSALERAYFAAKPTPHFWKKVAKMVPGKSAQECFDKIHSEFLTPPQAQPRSRVRARKSPLSLSASKLLNHSVEETKKRRYNKQKSHLAHKTVRRLLKKQVNLDHDDDADLFSILEQTLDPTSQVVEQNRLSFAPECQTDELGFDKRWVERSSACRKHLSQLNNSCESALTSPSVLKKIKNKALHEKYIDQLHSRGAKRNAASLRARKFIEAENGAKENNVQKMEAVKDAKNALVFYARDAISQFHHMQSSKVNSFENAFDDFAESSDYEFEDGS